LPDQAGCCIAGDVGRPVLSDVSANMVGRAPNVSPSGSKSRNGGVASTVDSDSGGFGQIAGQETSTLVLAVFRGLITDVEATGDVAQTDRAFDDVLATLTSAAARHPG